MHTTYLLNAKEFGGTYLQITKGLPENSEFHLGANYLWEKDNTGLNNIKVAAHLRTYVPRIAPEGSTP